jgi:hypothetical protein
MLAIANNASQIISLKLELCPAETFATVWASESGNCEMQKDLAKLPWLRNLALTGPICRLLRTGNRNYASETLICWHRG